MIKNVKMAILWDSVHFSLGNISMICRNLLTPSIGRKREFQRKPSPCLHHEDGGSRFPQNAGMCTGLHGVTYLETSTLCSRDKYPAS
jgi:hypothetical protein